MSSQVKLTLRPPPNVDFVHGYPGIPPGAPDRNQAAVKGAIEVRVPPSGVKAKWVRIELRKVETLPGGGGANTFYDFVGQSPINLWTAPDEYGTLRTQDFPFSIRIPESIPPTIALESRAGINYELIATVCTKGKRSWFRKAKSVVISTDAPIIIDKHELHSTWPVYCQPEERHINQDGIVLFVNRSHTCFGPGDRISVLATLKSESLSTNVLRGFEIVLKETTVFRHGAHNLGKKTTPQRKVSIICESKLPINVTLYGGSQHKAELVCMVPPNHTTTTLNAARYIDVTYMLHIKALMGNGSHLMLDLPVIISNWQRHVSVEAIRRIGPAPSLSLLPTPGSQQGHSSNPSVTRVEPLQNRPTAASTLPTTRNIQRPEDVEFGIGRMPSNQTFNSLPTQVASPTSTLMKLPEEVGYGFGLKSAPITPTKSTARTAPVADFEAPPPPAANSTSGTARRPNSSGSRFTIVNATPSELPNEASTRQPSVKGSIASKKWMTAEEEKQMLYERARARVEVTQAIAQSPASVTRQASEVTTSPVSAAVVSPPRGSSRTTPWPTAEEEKQRLFAEAQAAVQKNQGYQSHSPPTSPHSELTRAASSSKSGSNAAALYSQAISSMKSPVPHYPTAEQEKAALKRYEEAKRAVDRTQLNGYEEDALGIPAGYSGPVSYETLYPSPGSSDPPPFDNTSGIPAAHLSEKERMRQAYEAQDAAALLARQVTPPAPVAFSSPPPPSFEQPSSQGSYPNAFAEKEALRRKFEQQDADVAQTQSPSPHTPTRTPSSPNRRIGSRPSPIPPVVAADNKTRVLTAAEEKAMLQAKYEAENANNTPAPPQTNGRGYSHYSRTTPLPALIPPPRTPPPPPPLMPKPPVEYIQETQEEDARVARLTLNGDVPALLDEEDDVSPAGHSPASVYLNGVTRSSPPLHGDELRSPPMSAGFEVSAVLKSPGPPPPLPPKPAGD